MVVVSGTKGKSWGMSVGDAQPEPSCAGGGPQQGAQTSRPVLPPLPMPSD